MGTLPLLLLTIPPARYCRTEDPAVGTIFHCNDAYLTMVAVDDEGASVHLPFTVRPVTAEEHLRAEVGHGGGRRACPCEGGVREQGGGERVRARGG